MHAPGIFPRYMNFGHLNSTSLVVFMGSVVCCHRNKCVFFFAPLILILTNDRMGERICCHLLLYLFHFLQEMNKWDLRWESAARNDRRQSGVRRTERMGGRMESVPKNLERLSNGGGGSRVTSTSWKEVEGKVMEKVGIWPLSQVFGPLMAR